MMATPEAPTPVLAGAGAGPLVMGTPATVSLIEMIKTGDPEEPDLVVTFMNSNPSSVFTRDEHGATVLHWAALVTNLPAIRTAVTLGVPVHAVTNDGMEAIHWACTCGSWQAVQELLAHGADMNASNAQNATPVVLAAQYGHTELVNVLVKRGADINIFDEHQDSALHWAAYQGMLPTVGLLHHLGLSASDADAYGSTPLHLAVQQGQVPVVDYFLEQAEPALLQLKDNKGRTPMALAAEFVQRGSRRHAEILARLRAHQASNNVMRLLTCGAVGSAEAAKRPRSPFWFFIANAATAYGTYSLLVQPALAAPEYNALHTAFVASNVLMVLFFTWTVRSAPGYVPTDARAREAYEEELRAAADKATAGAVAAQQAGKAPQLCHTCHVVRPLRAKHCPLCGRCVLRHDHHCPWVDTCVGRDNYLPFCLLLVFGSSSCLLQLYALVTFLRIRGFHWWVAFLVVDFILSSFFGLSMVTFHTALVARNLTTNETVNWRKYPHLKRALGPSGNKVVFHNSFDGGICRNPCWRLNLVSFNDLPVKPVPEGPALPSTPDECCEAGHSHSHSHVHA